MTEENPNPPAAETPKVEVLLSLVSPMSVKDAAALSPAQRDLILAAAGRIAEADQAAADKIEADKRKAEQHEQSSEGRAERKAKAGA